MQNYALKNSALKDSKMLLQSCYFYNPMNWADTVVEN